MKQRLLASAALIATTIVYTPTTTWAQSADAGADEIEQIVVTARRTEERLQDVPISISVFSQDQLAARNIVSPIDLATYTPSLSVNQRFGPEKSGFVIRGFSQETNTSPSVGVYFADVVAPRAQGGTTAGNGAGAGSFFDLQNVQVLKGPQGTLFGRNTTGGAVLLVPQKPTDKLEGFVEGSVGNYDLRRVQAVLNVPLADSFKVRLGVDRNSRDGYMKNHSGIGPDAFNNTDYVAARLSIVAELTPELENYTIASYNHSFGVGYAGRIRVCDSTPIGSVSPFTGAVQSANRANTAFPACDQLARQNARGDSLLDVEVNAPNPKIDIEQWQVINTTTWAATDTLTIKNIASYAEFRERDTFSLNGDNFFVRAGLPNAGQRFQYQALAPANLDDNAHQSTFTEELQFQGRSSDGRFDWQAGAYIEISDPIGYSSGYTGTNLNCSDLQVLACTSPLGGSLGQVTNQATKTYFNNKGFYAQATYDLTEQFSVTGGIRYTIDKLRQLTQGSRYTLNPTTGAYSRICNNQLIVPSSPLPLTGEATACRQVLSTKSEKPTWLIDVDYKPTNDVLIYAKYARGYRQGGISGTNPGFEAWNPEKVDAYEIGAKTSFRGVVRGYFNIAGFWNEFSDQQVNVGLIAKPGFSQGVAIVNAGKSRIKGVEVDASISAFDGLRLDVGYAYLDTKVLAFTAPTLAATSPYAAVTPTVAVGSPLTYSPKNRVTATLSYKLPLDAGIGDIRLGATFTHTDTQRANTPASSPLYLLPAVDLLNLNLDWKDAFGQPIDVSVFATNVTNQIYAVAQSGSIGGSGFDGVAVGQPRMYGVRLRYRFGD